MPKIRRHRNLMSTPLRSVVFGINSFEHAIDRLEDRRAGGLNFVPELDERFIRDTDAWRSRLLSDLRRFFLKSARSAERLRSAIDAHTTLACGSINLKHQIGAHNRN
jgi:hypothetical protein